MSGKHGSKAGVWVNQYDLAGQSSSFDSQWQIETAEFTPMGGTKAKAFVPGVMSWKKTQKGFWNSNNPIVATDLAEVLEALKGTQVQTIFEPGGTAEGKVAKCGRPWLSAYSFPISNNAVIAVQLNYEGTGLLYRALVLGNTTQTGAINGTPFDFGAAGTLGVESFLCVTAFTGTNATIKVQSSATSGGAYVDRLTHTLVTASTFEFLTAGTTVDRWLRYALTGTITSISFVIAADPVGVNGWAST